MESESAGPDRWDQVCSAFNAALNAPAWERDALIRLACGDDQTMRAEVQRMIENHARATQENFLEAPNLTASFAPASGRSPPDRGSDLTRSSSRSAREDSASFTWPSRSALSVAGSQSR